MIAFGEGEQIVKIIRRHYLVILKKVFVLMVVTLAPFFLSLFLFSDFIPLEESVREGVKGFILSWSVFGYSIWLLVLWVAFFVEWTDYYLDLWIITNKRIIDVEQKGFFHREVTSFSFEQIQDITVETKGLLETFLKFGTLHIQTAGHNRDIIIKDAKYPEDARSLILKLQHQSKSI